MQRYSKKREAILACLRDTDTHPTADWIYTQLRPRFADLSLATVYRNLASLKNAGLIRSVGSLDGQEHFDGTVPPHPHAVCTVCGAIVDVPCEMNVDGLIGTAEETTGFSIREAALRFTGVCPACRARESAKGDAT